ncbi:MAG: hypothetical protein JXP72_04900 [Coriobacteriia bacterium]|nr:hypothetical protein [Coriobacteriia bacterium]
MLASALTRIRSRPVMWAFILLLGAVALAIAANQAVGWARFLVFSERLDVALSVAPSGASTECAWSFPFQQARARVSVPVYESEIAAARDLNIAAAFRARGLLRDAYVSRIVDAHAPTALVERLLTEFRALRDARGLDSDEYLELMTAAVQAIPYGEIDGEVSLPADVLTGGAGVCTEKSLLLASLMVAEGYDTVIWVFPTQWHVAVGVASEHARFRHSEYAFIETTSSAYIGQAVPSLWSRGPVARPPQEIGLGGSELYRSGDEVEFILRELQLATAIESRAGTYVQYLETPEHHRGRYAGRVMESWIAGTTARYIKNNAHDRRGVYRVLLFLGAHTASEGSADG